MDLDLLTYGDQISATPPLPRADILEYNFVLGPLAEIAGHVLHPQLRQSYADLWAAMQARTAPLQLFSPAMTHSGDSVND
jgi:2-amino-4-hydroxy-6-hydroxymethyldihydropteridine diphosphokinase